MRKWKRDSSVKQAFAVPARMLWVESRTWIQLRCLILKIHKPSQLSQLRYYRQRNKSGPSHLSHPCGNQTGQSCNYRQCSAVSLQKRVRRVMDACGSRQILAAGTLRQKTITRDAEFEINRVLIFWSFLVASCAHFGPMFMCGCSLSAFGHFARTAPPTTLRYLYVVLCSEGKIPDRWPTTSTASFALPIALMAVGNLFVYTCIGPSVTPQPKSKDMGG